MVSELQALVAAHPTRETLTGLLMIALYRCGRQADALDAYQRRREHLLGELGLDPGAALQELQAQVLAQDPSLELRTNDRPALPRRHRLPSPRSRGASSSAVSASSPSSRRRSPRRGAATATSC